MATTQTCDRCGKTISDGIEGFGARAGVGQVIFDLCDDCIEVLETYILDEFITGTLDSVEIAPVAQLLDLARERRIQEAEDAAAETEGEEVDVD